MIYNYKCRDCSTIFELEHSIKVSNAVSEIGATCSSCGSTNIFKYLGSFKTVPILFKGTGFAANDLALGRIGFPEHYKENPEIRKKLKNM